MSIEILSGIGYLAPENRVSDLRDELGPQAKQWGRVFWTQDTSSRCYWVQNTWKELYRIQFQSIREAASHLRSLQKNWDLYSHTLHRRASLIQSQLPPIRFKPFRFLDSLPALPLGNWTLLDSNTLLASPRCSSPFPSGVVKFSENKTDPPSRAYLKLWELFTLEGFRPKRGELCLDLGASPGAWTWVLSELGCRVISVDKAELNLATSDNVRFIKKDAFRLDPGELGLDPDWLFCDIICQPEKLLSLIHAWKNRSRVKNIVATLKFKGRTPHALIQKFADIPGSRLIHLFHNKHELTWIHQNE
jgi:23S rRNA (cytidine2498-2'-O)-methyltransferase